MSNKPIAILKNRFYVPSEYVTDEDLEEFTYTLNSYESQDPITIRTYKKFANDYIGFARGDMGKIDRVFGDRFEIQDERSIVPHGFSLNFTANLRADQERVWQEWSKKKYGLIKCPPRFGKCLVGSSLIFTDRGFVPLKDIVENKSNCKNLEVLTHTGPQYVSHFHSKGVSPIKKMTTYCGLSLSGTPEHPVLVLDPSLNLSWIPLSEVQPNKHHVAVSVGKNFFSKEVPKFSFNVETSLFAKDYSYSYPQGMTHELARLLGYFLGDGSRSGENTRILSKSLSAVEDFCVCFESCFGVKLSVEKRNLKRGVEYQVSFPLKAVSEFLQYIGHDSWVPKKHKIPWCILQAPREYIVSFLHAYFSDNGATKARHFTVSSASQELMQQFQMLLLNFGVVSRVATKTRKSYRYENRFQTYSILSITGETQTKFYETIKFNNPDKMHFASRNRRGSWTKDIPYARKALAEFMKRGKSGFYKKPDGSIVQFGFTRTVSSHSNRGPITRDMFDDHPELLSNIGLVDKELAYKLRAILELDLFFDEVTSVSDAPPEPVYDLTVPVFHSFTANGILAHNTVLSIYMMCKLRQRTLVLAHESGILQQFEDSVRKFTNIEELEQQNGVKLCGQLKNYEDVYPIVTFSTWQMLHQPGAADALKQNKDAFGLLFVDEAHACAAPCFSRVVSNFNPYYRIPITATDKRKDGFEVVVSDVMGPVTAEGTTSQLPVDVTVIWTKHEVKHFADWNGLWTQLVKDDKRNKLIAQQVVADVRAGHSCVVFTDRRNHAKLLEQAIMEEDPNLDDKIDILIGGSPKTSIRDRARSGETKVVIASPKIVQLGWDVPAWSSLHNTLPMANEPNWYQRLSRVRTPCSACPGTTESTCLKSGTCTKLKPVVRVYADPGHNVTFSCLAVMNRVHNKLGLSVQQIKPTKFVAPNATRGKKWSEVG